MRHITAIRPIALLAGVVATAATLASNGPAQVNILGGAPAIPSALEPSPVRQPLLHYRDGEDLSLRLPLGEDAVTFLFDRVPGVLLTPPNDMAFEEFLTREADAVAVVRPQAIRGELNARRDWIQSVVDADVISVLKTTTDARLSEANTRVVFRLSGGSTMLNGVQVTAAVTGVQPLQVGATYLVFLVTGPGGLFAMGPRAIYELSGDLLRCVDIGDVQVPFNNTQYLRVADKVRRARFLPRIAPRREGGQ